MQRNRILLLVALVFLLPLLCFYVTIESAAPPKDLTLYKYQLPTPLPKELDGKVSADVLAKLDGELAEILQKQAPGLAIRDPIINIKKGRIRVFYISDMEMPDELCKIFDGYIKSRLPQLMKEQATAAKSK